MNPTTSSDDWEWWWGAWRDRIRCGTCRALMNVKAPCPVCATDYSKLEQTEIVIDGRVHLVPPAFNGPLDWSPYVMLKLMYRDWQRPLGDQDASLPADKRPSSRVLVVLIFWTYFETLMGWYYETATSALPKPVASDLLTRYGTIGARIDRLHRILFEARYCEDLDDLGHTAVRAHLNNLQKQRNAFVHGNPEAIGDALVEDTVRLLPEFHEAWIESFNLRCAKRP